MREEIWADLDLRDKGVNLCITDIHAASGIFRAKHARRPENICVTADQWKLLGYPTVVLGMPFIVKTAE